MSPNCGLCVSSSDRRESNPRDFFKLALFSGRERNDVVVCLACGSGTFSGRLSLRLAVRLLQWDFQWEIESGLLSGLQWDFSVGD